MTNDMKNECGNDSTLAPVAIIGFGTAGVNAAIALRQAGYDGAIDVFSDLDTLPYSPILTSYYAGGIKPFDECFPWSDQEIDALALNIHQNEPVTELDVEAHVVRTSQGTFPYSKCIIATGSSPTTVGFPQDCGYEPLVLHSMDDALRMKAALENPRCEHVLVSGASMVALKIVEACLAQGKKVTLVGMNDHVLDFNALPEAAVRFERNLEAKGVAFKLGQTIQKVCVKPCEGHPEGRVLEVSFSNGDTEEFDEIAVAHGMKSNLGFIKPGTLDRDQGLLVDEFMRTSNPDVYAVGDVAQALELTSGERRIVGIWKNAALQGACAGKAIACELSGIAPQLEDAYMGSISSNTIAIDGTLFLSAGTIDAGANGEIEVREDDNMTVVYIYRSSEDGKNRQLVGFNITSDTDEEGGIAYDTGAMLTLRIKEGFALSNKS